MSDQIDHIEKYLNGNLSPEETEKFEEELTSDPELQEKVALHRQLMRGLEIGFNRELKELLVAEESKLKDPLKMPKRRTKPLYPILSFAAVIAILIVSVIYLVGAPDHETLFSDYYAVYPNIESPISRSDEVSDNPFVFYEQGNYSQALKVFKEALTSEPTNAALYFYSGICQVELNQTEQAISSFAKVADLPENNYSRTAQWYQSLAFLKMGDISNARMTLEKLTYGEDTYAVRAGELLKDL